MPRGASRRADFSLPPPRTLIRFAKDDAARERERERENRQKDCSSGGTDAPLTWSRMRDDDDERYSRIKMWTEGIKITGRRLSRR